LDEPVIEEVSFPRQYARTGRFGRGAPRLATVSPDGARVTFLRSGSGTDPVAALWVLDVDTAVERLVADPAELLAGGAEELSPEERARRERIREAGAGIVAYATDESGSIAAFALSGRLFLADLVNGGVRELPASAPVADPRPDPTGTRVAYASAGALRVVGTDPETEPDRALVEADGAEVTWGLAEFIASEEMDRYRGYWWAPDGRHLLVERADEAPVQRWYIGDPANPGIEPAKHAYPAAGTPNADVSLFVVGLDGGRTEVMWDRQRFEYLVTASWTGAAALVVVQTRDQRTIQVREVDPASGVTDLVREDSDPVWTEIVPGVPEWCGDRLVWAADVDGWRRLVVDGQAVTPVGLQVRAVRGAGEAGVLFVASEEPTQTHLWCWHTDGRLEQVTATPGVHSGTWAGSAGTGSTLVVVSADLRTAAVTVTVRRGDAVAATLCSYAATPTLTPRVTFHQIGARALRAALVLPAAYDGSGGALPVLMHPYGGPHAQRVTEQLGAYLTEQWIADQGFAVVIVDGRGTPGRGAAWERAIFEDLASTVLEDQVDGLLGLAKDHAELDLTRVAITGWSFGGYLAALAVLRRPDVFHAAVAGAPVTDWRLYDTHYTERYLGNPDVTGETYDAVSLIDEAGSLERPLMIIHGLADDNVVAANSLRLSGALLAAGRPHTVLPLSGVTHMTPQEEVAENLLLLQVGFLKRELGV
jgi:dipeptidyl-peptidase-4